MTVVSASAMVPEVVMVPPVNPVPAVMLVTVPPELGEELVSVIVPPKATVPPPDIPVPAVTVTDGFASIAFEMPAFGTLIVPVVVIGPPVSPAPVATFVTVPVPPQVGQANVTVPVQLSVSVSSPD